MANFDTVVLRPELRQHLQHINEDEVRTTLRQMLISQLERDRSFGSAAWYLGKDQAFQFARMTLGEISEPQTNGAREMALIEEILDQDLLPKNVPSISFVDLGCGNGEKAWRILQQLRAPQVLYWAVDASPYMSAFCVENIAQNFGDSDISDAQIIVGDINASNIDSVRSIDKARLAELINDRKRLLHAALDEYNALVRHCPAYDKYMARKRAEWNSLSVLQKNAAIERENHMLDDICQQEDELDRESSHLSPTQVKKRIDELHSRPRPITYVKLVYQLSLFHRLLAKLHEGNASHERAYYKEVSPVDYLGTMRNRLSEVDDIFDDPRLIQLAKVLQSQTCGAMAEAASLRLRKLRDEIERGEEDQVYNLLHMLEQDLYQGTLLRSNGYLQLGSHNVSERYFDVLRWKGLPVAGYRGINPHFFKREFILTAPKSTRHCDFLNGDLETLFKSAVFNDCLSAPASVVALLGQTIGNFSGGNRARILKRVYNAMKPGDVIFLGAELRPSEEDPNLAEKVTVLRKYYGAPELNGGYIGEGEKFLRHALREVGIKDESVSYSVEYNDHRIEMYFTFRENAVASCGDKRLELQKGERILAASSYKFTLKELSDLVQGAGFNLVMVPDRHNYTVIVGRK